MSTTYFNNSNIKRLKNKKVSKKKDVTDINTDNEKVVESFTPSGSIKEENPKSNIFGSSDSDKTTNTINPTSATGKQDSNTTAAASTQVNPGSILIFCFHALLSVLFVYIWGALATNAIYLISESDDNLDYILPDDEYKTPYTKNPESKRCWYKYGFPYSLGEGRVIGDEQPFVDKEEIKKRQKDTTYFLWLSAQGKSDPRNQQGFFSAFMQYLFEAVYGGLGRGGRTLIRILLEILKVKDKVADSKTDTWYGKMENRTMLKVAAFIIWPFFMLQLLVPVVAIWSGITTFGFGILQTHIVWGLIFSFTIGMFVAMANGFYMAIQTIYIFFIYPWSNDNSDTKDKWKNIFNNLNSYMLLVFYFIICFYGYEDLGASGGAGIMFIVIVSIVLQYLKNSS
jgi:hypothetical protein